MSRIRFIFYFCILSGLCVTAFGRWVPQMPVSDTFPIDLQGHTVPLDPVTGLVTLSSDELYMSPAPEADAVWAKVSRAQPVTATPMVPVTSMVTVASVPQ